MIDIQTLSQLSKTNKIDRFTILREILQISFLNYFYKSPEGKNVFFKGGTCLKLLYNSNRFSEDLDFSTSLDHNGLKKIVSKTVESLNLEYPEIYYKDIDSISGVTKKIYLPTEITAQPLTIRLDFSQREKVFLPRQKTISTDLPVLSVSVINYMDQKEILAEKIRAIMARERGRDLYDFWFLLNKKVEFDKKLIQKKLDLYKKKYSLEKLIERINSWNEKELTQDVSKFLPKNDRMVLQNLKKFLLKELSLQTNSK